MASIFGSKKNLYQQIIDIHKISSSSSYLKLRQIQIGLITHNCSGVSDFNKSLFMNYKDIDNIIRSDILIVSLQEILEMKSKNFASILINSNENYHDFWL